MLRDDINVEKKDSLKLHSPESTHLWALSSSPPTTRVTSAKSSEVSSAPKLPIIVSSAALSWARVASSSVDWWRELCDTWWEKSIFFSRECHCKIIRCIFKLCCSTKINIEGVLPCQHLTKASTRHLMVSVYQSPHPTPDSERVPKPSPDTR